MGVCFTKNCSNAIFFGIFKIPCNLKSFPGLPDITVHRAGSDSTDTSDDEGNIETLSYYTASTSATPATAVASTSATATPDG